MNRPFISLLLLSLLLFSSFSPAIIYAWEGEGSGEVIVKMITGMIIVSNNIESASFIITGSKEFNGQGTLTIFSNVPSGVYTINYKDIVGYETPQPETKMLSANGKIEFIGKYSLLSILIPGKDVPVKAPGFFPSILTKLSISISQFAVQALTIWANYENTNAYWNPLATGWDMGEKSQSFNEAGVKNYVDEEIGVQATANTLALPYYESIREMLAIQSFNEQSLREAVAKWSYLNPDSSYVVNLVNEWCNIYPKIPTSRSISPPCLREIIKQYAQEEKTKAVVVDGKQYFIVTLKGYIHPVTLEPTEFTPPNPSGEWKVYVDAEGQPIRDEDILWSVSLVDKANQLSKKICAFTRAQWLYDTIFALEKLEHAEKITSLAERWAGISIDMAISLPKAGISIAELIAKATSSTILDLEKEGTDPQKIKGNIGYMILLEAQKKYYAAAFTQGTRTEFNDSETAEKYLNFLYTAFLYEVYGTGLSFSPERISKNPIYDIVIWGFDHIIGKYTHEISDILGLTKNIVDLPSTIKEDLEIKKNINSKVEELMYKPELPFYYTLALAYRDITRLKEYPLEPYLYEHVACPVELRVYDSENRVTGIVSGDIKIEIPNSFYYNNTVIVFFPSDLYKHEIVGITNGSYGLTIEYVENKTTSLIISEIPISANETHQYIIEGNLSNQTVTIVNLQIDSNNDGTFEKSVDLFNVKESISTETELIKTGLILLIILSVISIIVIKKLKNR